MAALRDAQPHAAHSDFPTDPSEFLNDERISWSKLENKYLLETEQGAEFEWDDALRRWVAVLDQADLEQQQQIYKVDGVEDDDADATVQKKKRKKKADESEQQAKKQRVNTAVYVTSIPLDAGEDEIKQVFSRCGMIAEEIDSGRPRIKMYEDSSGRFKGDALVVYFRPESVDLAVQMLDDSDFRPGEQGPDGRMRVQIADYSYKRHTEAPDRTKSNKRDQQKIIKKTQKMNSRLADWDDDDPQTLQETGSRWDKVVILKHMFTLQELEEDPAVMLEIKEDIREECEKLGQVTNVQLFDKEPDGVASVRFTDARAAEACVQVMNGRWFDERQLQAFIATGREKFKRANAKQEILDEDADDDEVGRLDKFGSWLEGEEDAKDPAQKEVEADATNAA